LLSGSKPTLISTAKIKARDTMPSKEEETLFHTLVFAKEVFFQKQRYFIAILMKNSQLKGLLMMNKNQLTKINKNNNQQDHLITRKSSNLK
jgi:hypothetical protein